MKEIFKILFSGTVDRNIYIEVRSGFEVYVWDGGTGYGQASITKAFEYVKEKYPNHKMIGVQTELTGIFNFPAK